MFRESPAVVIGVAFKVGLCPLAPPPPSAPSYPLCVRYFVAGVDFKTKTINVSGVSARLQIWDTAGQERFRTLTSSYYRGAQGIIFVYDVTRPATLSSLEDTWLEEVDMYCTVRGAARMVVGNKTDRERVVPTRDGAAFARRAGALFVEASALGGDAVDQAFEELVLKILDTPELLEQAAIRPGAGANRIAPNRAARAKQTSGCC